MQRYTIFFIIVNALHVSGGFSAHHQELKNRTHSIGYMPSLLAATASVGEFRLTQASGSSKQAWYIPDAVCTAFELLMFWSPQITAFTRMILEFQKCVRRSFHSCRDSMIYKPAGCKKPSSSENFTSLCNTNAHLLRERRTWLPRIALNFLLQTLHGSSDLTVRLPGRPRLSPSSTHGVNNARSSTSIPTYLPGVHSDTFNFFILWLAGLHQHLSRLTEHFLTIPVKSFTQFTEWVSQHKKSVISLYLSNTDTCKKVFKMNTLYSVA